MSSKVEAERDLYRKLLDLAEVDEPLPFLDATCVLLQRCTQAASVLLGVYRDGNLLWHATTQMAPPTGRQTLEHLSTGILSNAVQSGEWVQTSSALLDARFSSRASVRRNQIEAVLCAPVPLGEGVTFVVYLQRQAGEGPFAEDAVANVRRIADRLETISARALAPSTDPTADVRSRLEHCDLVGRSQPIARLLEQVATMASLDLDVLLTGESGTGKSHLARLLHANSPRARGPMVHVNCPAIPEALFEAEMFGAKAGAYTGATQSREGFVQQAKGGTLFLDEVGDLPLNAQAKLLQLLQERTYTRVGDPTPRRADVRVLAATHLDLDAAIREGRFRADLRYRLEVIPLRVPSLAERREDIRPLLDHAVRLVGQNHPTLASQTLSPSVRLAMVQAEWPGNVRELTHRVKASMVRAHSRGRQMAELEDAFPGRDDNRPLSWQGATRAFQEDLLRSTLADEGGNVVAAAKRLDLGRSRAYELVRAFGLSTS